MQLLQCLHKAQWPEGQIAKWEWRQRSGGCPAAYALWGKMSMRSERPTTRTDRESDKTPSLREHGDIGDRGAWPTTPPLVAPAR